MSINMSCARRGCSSTKLLMDGRIELRNPKRAWHRRMLLLPALHLRVQPVGISSMTLMTIPSWTKVRPDLTIRLIIQHIMVRLQGRVSQEDSKLDISAPMENGRGNSVCKENCCAES